MQNASTTPADSREVADQLLVTSIRAMEVREPEDDQGPALAVAHLSGTVGDRELSVIGQVQLRTPLHDYHRTAESWDVVEGLLAKLVTRTIPLTSARAINRALRPLLAELKQESAAAAAARPDTPSPTAPLRRRLYRRLRRLGRRVRDVIKGRRTHLDPDLRPARLVGVQAVRVALLGAAASLRGEAGGKVRGGSWQLGDVDSCYEQFLERFGRYACAPPPPQPSIDGRTANTFPDVAYIGRLPKDGTKGHLLEREALRYGLSTERFPNGAFVATDTAGRRLNFKWGRSPIASGVSLSICSYKEATRRLLERVDVPVPRGRVFAVDEVDKALDYADRIGYPVVCKPVAGLRGIGVVSNIRSRDELVQALDLYAKSELGSDDFVIEQHITGSDYRIVVIGGHVVAAVVREPASVVGDGIHTIADLVEYKNRVRRLNPHLRSRPIRFSDAMAYQLAQAGLTYSSVPDPGQRVVLANSANLSQGGDSFEIAHELHPSIRETALRAVEAVPGLGFCGLDMLIEDHRKPVDEQQATVIELNAHAAIGSAQYPMWGTPTPVARLFFEECARAYGVELPDKQLDDLSLRIVVRGKVVGVNYRRWFKRRADHFGVSGTIENTARKEVTAFVHGPADAVSALAYLAINGPRSSGPTSVKTTHAAVPFQDTGFRIIR